MKFRLYSLFNSTSCEVANVFVSPNDKVMRFNFVQMLKTDSAGYFYTFKDDLKLMHIGNIDSVTQVIQSVSPVLICSVSDFYAPQIKSEVIKENKGENEEEKKEEKEQEKNEEENITDDFNDGLHFDLK